MDDKNQEVFRKYDIRVYATYKARGAVILETDKGLLLLKSVEGSTARVEFENTVKEFLIRQGYTSVDLYLRNIEGELITEDYMGNRYVLKNWFVGEECDPKETKDVLEATKNLAYMHTRMVSMPIEDEIKIRNTQPSLFETFDKRNRELKRVRSYIKDKRQKNEFELYYLNYYGKFYEEGLKALDVIKNSDYMSLYEKAVANNEIVHGNYTYHNVMMLRGNQPASCYETSSRVRVHPDNDDYSLAAAELTSSIPEAAATNFDKASIGMQVYDLYHFLRKVMEKNDWDIDYGSMMVRQYSEIKPLSNSELKIIYALLLYPEKFWKITNFYYNSKKSWVPQRIIQKLISIEEQYESKKTFLKQLEGMIQE